MVNLLLTNQIWAVRGCRAFVSSARLCFLFLSFLFQVSLNTFIFLSSSINLSISLAAYLPSSFLLVRFFLLFFLFYSLLQISMSEMNAKKLAILLKICVTLWTFFEISMYQNLLFSEILVTCLFQNSGTLVAARHVMFEYA